MTGRLARAREHGVHQLSCYDGTRQTGVIWEHAGRCRAWTRPTKIDLGDFANRRDALRAIGLADRAGRRM
jgi:hypothetical protein